jgi:glucosamine-6-phosphate deaminase
MQLVIEENIGSVRLLVTEDYAALSRAGADLIVGVIRANPAAAMVLATGETPMGVYRALAVRRQRGEFDTLRLRIFQLDAYLGLAAGDPRSLSGWLARSVLEPLGIPEANVVRLPGDSPDPQAACRAYDAAVRAAGGFDLAVLGLGPNGHLGFNEPPSDAGASTRVVALTEASLQSNARYWGATDQVPRAAITAGMDILLAARQTLLLVSGEHKRKILRRTVVGPVNPQVPASYLQRAADVTVIADRAAWATGPTLASADTQG